MRSSSDRNFVLVNNRLDFYDAHAILSTMSIDSSKNPPLPRPVKSVVTGKANSCIVNERSFQACSTLGSDSICVTNYYFLMYLIPCIFQFGVLLIFLWTKLLVRKEARYFKYFYYFYLEYILQQLIID